MTFPSGQTSRFFLRSVLGLAVACASLNLAASEYSSSEQVLSVDAVDVYNGAELVSTMSVELKLISVVPLQFQVSGSAQVARPGGNRGTYSAATRRVTLPGVSVDGNFTYSLEMERVPGSSPAVFSVISADKLSGGRSFNRIATFPAFMNTDIGEDAVAEIVDASEDGNTLVYTDSVGERIGFVDISSPADPKPLGVLAVGGEPTSVAVAGGYALVGVNTSADFVNVSGKLIVVDMSTRTAVTSFDLLGQPDSVAVSPDGNYAAVVIENERDEDLGDGAPPQAPAGLLVSMNISSADPTAWTMTDVDMSGVPDLYPTDPEPEYVDINANNQAIVSLQENNHFIVVDLVTNTIVNDFPAGSVDLDKIDIEEESPGLISLTGSLEGVLREPDGVSWIDATTFGSANEGDLNGGSRGWSIFDSSGALVSDAGNALEHEVVRLGHYPDSRSENKGNEPENIETGTFGATRYMFVASERSSVIFAYDLDAATMQTLPATLGPEGIKAIPSRKLLVAATEEDSRGDGYRGGLAIYQLQSGPAAYPNVVSVNRDDGTPIPWSALSGLAADRANSDILYSVPDSYYQQSRIYTMDFSSHPAVITAEHALLDSGDLLAAVSPDQVNADKSVNLDLEGISASADGGFWLVSEGAGTVGDDARPVTSPNLLLHTNANGVIDQVVELPATTDARQLRFGFEGVTATGSAGGELVYVAFQRSWADDPAGMVRIGRYDEAADAWAYYYYPLDAVESANGGWVGLSDITALDDGRLLVLERDNQANADAAVKRIYSVSTAGLSPLADTAAGSTPGFPQLQKTLLKDLLPEMQATGGMVLEKIEGMAVQRDGTVIVVNDNDGVEDSNGETQVFRVEGLL